MSENGRMYFVRTEHIGWPVFATDTTGPKVWEASYLPFGGVQSSTGPNPSLRFPGQWVQSETGLHQNWMRDYDPTLGRYMQADPLGLVDGASVYGYALQNPGRYTDPMGESCIPYSLPDGNTGLNCTGQTCLSGQDCSWRIPEPAPSEEDICTQECMETLNLENWKTGPNLACTAIGSIAGVLTETGPIASIPVNRACMALICSNKCNKQCEYN